MYYFENNDVRYLEFSSNNSNFIQTRQKFQKCSTTFVLHNNFENISFFNHSFLTKFLILNIKTGKFNLTLHIHFTNNVEKS